MTDVVTALIWRGEEFLICLRPPDKPNPLRWEFVGGKAEKGESLEAALIRECREELDVEIKVNDIFAETDHEYPDITIHLTLFNAEIVSGEPKMLVHRDLKWITPDRIPEFNFCPADKDILKKITEKYGNK
ncbi:MAG: (deoxy)nucleoside triphosphate pyrophosphohydrolase [Clostridia bacterium]|nr:(deoxy)nucleoside triphosphate pyrophosphohydrolase [Clostridia bacterium]MBO5299960.1 (deoxy)nucleoside triphosphate pyrophosphohydrolase [Clostridia bacterium]